MHECVDLVDLSGRSRACQRVFSYSNRRRYSRERARRSLGENSIHYSFASLGDTLPIRAGDGGVFSYARPGERCDALLRRLMKMDHRIFAEPGPGEAYGQYLRPDQTLREDGHYRLLKLD